MPNPITPLKLVIDAPANGAKVAAQGAAITVNVAYNGHVVNPPNGVTLYYKWYSSLYVPAQASLVALNAPNFTSPNGQQALGVGSHVLTFTARDQSDDGVAATQQVKFAGLAGGPPQNPQPPPEKQPPPCIIHIFAAVPAWPPTGTLSKATGLFTPQPGAYPQGLEAAAPVKWRDPTYQALNRIRYVWKFAQPGKTIPDVRTNPSDLTALSDPTITSTLAEKDQPTWRVRLNKNAVSGLANGNYTVTLRVEDISDSTIGHEVAVSGTLTIAN